MRVTRPNRAIEDGMALLAIDFAKRLRLLGDSRKPHQSLFTALREFLGLELKGRQVPVQMLVIDHVDKAPTPN
jgi:uncharacterized protein (TIGR03435 family)